MKNNIGCRYGSEYMGVFCYADDLSLLCPSFTGIKEMLKTCEYYVIKHKVVFNVKKSQILTFDHKSRISVEGECSVFLKKIILWMKTIHYSNTLRSHLVTTVPMVPFTLKLTLKLRSAQYFSYSIVIRRFSSRTPTVQ